MDYDATAELVDGQVTMNGLLVANLFSRWGALSSGVLAHAGANGLAITRLETNWTHYRPESMTVWRAGDTISRPGAGLAPVRLAGIQFSRDFGTQPELVTFPLPAISGSAALPSAADIYIDGVLRSTQPLAPGPFDIDRIPANTGGGRVEVVIRDLLGRQQIQSLDYYASADLLTPGLSDFSFEAGWLRRNFGVRSNDYGALFGAATYRVGLSNRLTAEGHVDATEKVRLFSLAGAYLLQSAAVIMASGAVSHSDGEAGLSASLALERRARGVSMGLRGEWSSAAFTENGAPPDLERPMASASAYLDFPLLGGSLAGNLFYRLHRARADEGVAGLSFNSRLGRLGYLSATVQRGWAGRDNMTVAAFLTIPLGERRSVSASVTLANDRLSADASFQQDLPLGPGTGFRASARTGDIDRAEISVTRNERFLSWTAQLARSGRQTGLRLSASGAIGAMGGEIFAARSLGPSFALVDVGQPNVRIYAENQLIGRTGAGGTLIVPRLRPFEDNVVRIDDSDLPLDAAAPSLELSVRPFPQSGLVMRFDARRDITALVTLFAPDGSPLPPGARVSGPNGVPQTPVVGDGLAYLTGLAIGRNRIEASTGFSSCTFEVNVPEQPEPQLQLGDITCRATQSAAASN